jgi:ribose-phosphate pyrophosphokinase
MPMGLKILAGTANPPLAEGIARMLARPTAERVVERFPDGELHVELRESVRGEDVYVIQPTGPPVGEHLLELLLLADACRRGGAARTTAIVPYFGYARQDRRTRAGEPLGGRLMAELMRAAAVDRVVAVDLHTAALESAFAMPLEHLSAVPLLAAALRPGIAADTVVVSPDLGAVKLAERYARLLARPVAIVHKQRLSGSEVRAHGLVGQVAGMEAVVVDDMLSTGGTIEAAVQTLLSAGALTPVTVAVTHSLLVGPARERLARLPIRRLLATDSLPPPGTAVTPPLEVTGLAALLAEAVQRLHADAPLADLLAQA